MKPGMITAILAVTLLSACSSVKSKPASLVDGTSQTGLQYSAPKSMFAVKLVEVGDQILVSISDPFPVGDPNATFTLTATSGTFANQMYDFRVDDRTRLLSTVRSDSLGVLDEVLIDLGKAAGGYRATRESAYYAGAAERVLYHRIIDPMMEDDCGFAKACTLTTLGRELQIAAQAALNCADTAEYGENRLCAASRSGTDMFTIQLTPLFALDTAPTSSRAARGCRGSICYRTPVPYEIRLRIADITDISQIVDLPNKAPVLNLKLPAGIFADAKSFVELRDGMPVRVRSDRESEVGVAAGVPLKVINGFFSSAAEIVRLRIDYNSAAADAAASETAKDEALRERRIYRDQYAEAPRYESSSPAYSSTYSAPPYYSGDDPNASGARESGRYVTRMDEIEPMDGVSPSDAPNAITSIRESRTDMLSVTINKY